MRALNGFCSLSLLLLQNRFISHQFAPAPDDAKEVAKDCPTKFSAGIGG